MNVVGMLARGIVRLVDDARKVQQVQAELVTPGQAPDEIEVAQPYGYSAKPPTGIEAVFAAIGASRANTVLFGFLDRNRPKDLEAGEVGLHYLGDFKVFLKADGKVYLGGKDATELVALASKVETELNAVRNLVASHTHAVTTTGSATTQSGTTAPAGGAGSAGSVAAENTLAK